MDGFNGYVKYGTISAGATALVTCTNSLGTPIMCNTFSFIVSGSPTAQNSVQNALLFVPSSLIPTSALGSLTQANSHTATSGYIGKVVYSGEEFTLGAGKYVSSFNLINLGSTSSPIVVNYGITTQLNPIPKYTIV